MIINNELRKHNISKYIHIKFNIIYLHTQKLYLSIHILNENSFP